MKNTRVLFMGTPQFAQHILDHLLKNKYNIVGVVTAPDKPAGRGRKIHTSAVKRFAAKKSLRVLQPTNLKAESFQQDLKDLSPDIAVVVAFRMLPKKVWSYPKLGTFNLHASLLPNYRGAAPINWAIINGETETGVTTFFLDEEIDTGKIIQQQKVAISFEDNAGMLHDKLLNKGKKLVAQTIDLIEKDNILPKPQQEPKKLKPAPKLNNTNTKIDWNSDLFAIYNLIRGLSPYPVSWTIFKNGKKELRCKIFEAKPEEAIHDFTIGKIIKSKKDLKVAVQNGFIHILNMQLPGKRKMPVDQILNGLHLKENSCML